MAGNYPGIYRGICFDTSDPEGRYRIRVKVPQLLGDVPTGWAWPCLVPGWRNALVKPHGTHGGHSAHTYTDTSDAGTATLTTSGHDHNHDAHTNNHARQQDTPNVGEGVWVMFEGGDSDYPVWMGTF